MNKKTLPDDVYKIAQEKNQGQEKFTTTITICCGTGCRASGSMTVLQTLENEIAEKDLTNQVHIRATGCHGFCEQGPMMILEPGNIFCCHIKPEDVLEIVEETVRKSLIYR
jgi:NADH-quinone oxidoreductase subunit F